MGRTLSNWEYRAVLSECEDLAGRRLEKIYEIEPGLLRLDFAYGDSLMVRLGEYFYRTRTPPSAPASPSAYAMYLRKHLEGRRLNGIEQVGGDRLYRLSFGEAPQLLLEQFAGGNLFLLDGSGRILRAYHAKPSEKRVYHSGDAYAYPPSGSFTFPPGEAEWAAALGEKPQASVSALLSRWPIGKPYIQDLLAGQGVAERKAAELGEAERTALLGTLAAMLERRAPRVYEDAQGRGVEVALGPLARLENEPYRHQTYPTFSAALERFFKLARADQPAAPDPQFIRLQKRMEEQRTTMERLETEIAEAQEETAWLEARLTELEERRERILSGAGTQTGVDAKRKSWRIAREE